MTAKRHFGFGREIAHIPAFALRCGKDRFGIAHLGSDPLHHFPRGHRVQQDNAGRVSASAVAREGGDSLNLHLSAPKLLRNSISLTAEHTVLL